MRNTGRLLKIASNHLTTQLNEFSKKYDLTWNQMSLIDYLSKTKQCTQKDIEEEFTIQKSTASIMIKRMEEKKLVTKQVNTNDARHRNIELTEKAKPLIEEVNKFMKVQQQILEDNFTEDEINNFEKILYFLINNGISKEKMTGGNTNE